MHDVVLKAGGVDYAGWKSMRVNSSMERCSSTFELEVSERWPGGAVPPSLIHGGDSCELLLDGGRVIFGYVDTVEFKISAGQHTVRITGRDTVADLIDSSAVYKSGQWRGRNVLQIANDLCRPFGIPVTADVDIGKPFVNFALQSGATVFDELEHLARMRALLLMSDKAGGLIFTRAGNSFLSTRLVLGKNVLDASVSLDMRDRFSSYRFLGQSSGIYFEQAGGITPPTVYTEKHAEAKDDGVKRHRPLVLHATSGDAGSTLQQRANWEASVRRARSTEVSVTVQGWAHRDGLWEPNRIVQTLLPDLRIDDAMLIKSVQFELGAEGTKTQLALTMKDAFSALPIKVAAAPRAYLEGVNAPRK